MTVIHAEGLRKQYGCGEGVRWALDGVSLTVRKGELVAVLGPSGCGKSTLLGILGGLDRTYDGKISLFGEALETMSDPELARLRGSRVGFVFQAFHLLGHLSVLDNVLAPTMFAATADPKARGRAADLLAEVGLKGRGRDRPEQLSGGERQRVAIARAIMMEPELLLCDEPTGNLDVQTGQQIVDIFQRLHKEHGLTIVAVTHEETLASVAERIVQLRDGRIVEVDA